MGAGTVLVSSRLPATMQHFLVLRRPFHFLLTQIATQAHTPTDLQDLHEINLILARRRRVIRLLVVLDHSRVIPKEVTQVQQIAPELRIRLIGASGTGPGQHGICPFLAGQDRGIHWCEGRHGCEGRVREEKVKMMF